MCCFIDLVLGTVMKKIPGVSSGIVSDVIVFIRWYLDLWCRIFIVRLILRPLLKNSTHRINFKTHVYKFLLIIDFWTSVDNFCLWETFKDPRWQISARKIDYETRIAKFLLVRLILRSLSLNFCSWDWF